MEWSLLLNCLGFSLIHFLWQGLLLFIVVAIGIWLIPSKNSPARYCLGIVTLGLMPAVFCATFFLHFCSLDNPSIQSSARVRNDELPKSSSEEQDIGQSILLDEREDSSQGQPIDFGARQNDKELGTSLEARMVSLSSASSNWAWESFQVRKWAVLFWTIGVGLLLIRMLWNWVMAQRLLASGKPVDSALISSSIDKMLQRLEIKNSVRWLVSSQIVTPMVIGAFRPVILVPSAMLTGLSPVQIQMILTHELVHIRRFDYFVNLLQSLIDVIFFYHPAVWWISARVRLERENCCDDQVIRLFRSKKEYIQALLWLENSKFNHTHLALSSNEQLVERIYRMVKSQKPSTAINVNRSRVVPFVFTVIAGLMLIFGGVLSASEFRNPIFSETVAEELVAREDESPQEKFDMVVRVVDQRGEAIKDAEVTVGIWMPGNATTNIYQTGKEGNVKLWFPFGMNILRIIVKADGRAPMFATWEKNDFKDGDVPPKKLVFRMEPGIVAGGRIVDPSGNPVEGARVRFRLAGWRKGDSKIQFDPNLGEVKTGEDGKFSISNARNHPKTKLGFYVYHPAFVSDSPYSGGIQSANKITTEKLLQKTAEIQLQFGNRFEGFVKDPEGKAVAGAVVLWGEEAAFSALNVVTTTDENGYYQTDAIDRSEVPLTVIAPGLSPWTANLKKTGAQKPQVIQLKTGKKIEIQFVDQDGDYIDDVFVGVRRWKGRSSIYNGTVPSVPDTGIPTRTQEDGVYRWDWAPDGAVTYQFSTGKLFGTVTKSLSPKEKPHVVILRRIPELYGKVVDQKGEKVEEFQAILCYQTENQKQIRESENKASGTDGEFSIRVKGPSKKVCLRIIAHGYEYFRSPMFDVDHLPESFRFVLKKSERSSVRVEDQFGNPIIGARLATAGKKEQVQMLDFHQLNSYRVSKLPRSGPDGKFFLQARDEDRSFMAFSKEGYAEGVIKAGSLPNRIVLKRWAKLRVRFDGLKKTPNPKSIYTPNRYLNNKSYQFFQMMNGTQQEGGWFEFTRIPPVPGVVWEPQYGATFYQRRTHGINPKPGESIAVDFTKSSNKVIAKIQLKGQGAEKIPLHACEYYIRAAKPSFPLHRSAINEVKALGLDPFQTCATNQKLGFLGKSHLLLTYQDSFDWSQSHLTKDGKIVDSFIRPGTYWLRVKVYPNLSRSRSPYGSRSEFVKKIEIKKGVNDLGKIVVNLIPDPKTSQKVQDFGFIDRKTKKKLSLASLHQDGKYTLLDFWHSWGADNQEEVTLVAKDLSAIGKVNLLSLEGAGTGGVKRVKKKFGSQKWIDAKLIPNSEREVRRHLGVWNVHHFVLIDPKGNFVAGGDLQTVRKKLKELSLY